MRCWWFCAALSAVAITAGCAPAANTDYEGTWAHRLDDDSVSTLAIVRQGDDYRFRWSWSATDAGKRVECDWDGRCVGFSGEQRTAEYDFRTWIDPESGLLMVECRGRNSEPEEHDVHWIDRLEVSDDGRRLYSYKIQEAGADVEGNPPVVLQRVSDSVTDPPPAPGSRDG